MSRDSGAVAAQLRGGATAAAADSCTQTEVVIVPTLNSRSTQTNPRTRSVFTKSSRFSPPAGPEPPPYPLEDGIPLSQVTLSGDRVVTVRNRLRGKNRGKINRMGAGGGAGGVRRRVDFLGNQRNLLEDEPVVNIDDIAAILAERLDLQANPMRHKSLAPAVPKFANVTVAPGRTDAATSTKNISMNRATDEFSRLKPAPFGFNPNRRLELGRNPLAISDPLVTLSGSDGGGGPFSKALVVVKSSPVAKIPHKGYPMPKLPDLPKFPLPTTRAIKAPRPSMNRPSGSAGGSLLNFFYPSLMPVAAAATTSTEGKPTAQKSPTKASPPKACKGSPGTRALALRPGTTRPEGSNGARRTAGYARSSSATPPPDHAARFRRI